MSILTWQQVVAPDYSTAQRANERAQQLILGGIQSAQQIPETIAATQQSMDNIEQGFAAKQMGVELDKATTPEAVDRLVKQGILQGNFGDKSIVRPSMITPDLVKELGSRRDHLADVRGDREEADAAKRVLKLAPDSLDAAMQEASQNDWRNQKEFLEVAKTAADLSRGKEALRVAATRGSGRGKKLNEPPIPQDLLNLAQRMKMENDIRGSQRLYGGLPEDTQILLGKALEKVGATDILASLQPNGSVPTTGNRNYSAGSDSQIMSIRHSNLLGLLEADQAPPPPGYDFKGQPTSAEPPTYGDIYEYDNTVVRPRSNSLPKGKDSGASGPFQLTPTTRRRAAEAIFKEGWRTTRQTVENERKLAEYVWRTEGPKAWKDSLEGLLKSAGITESAQDYFKGRTFEEMAPMISALETGMLPDNFQSKISALEQSIAQREENFSRTTEGAILKSWGVKETTNDAAARVTAAMTKLGGDGVDGAVIKNLIEDLSKHASYREIPVSATELGELILMAMGPDRAWTVADVAKNFDIKSGAADTYLSAVPAAREAARKLKDDMEGLRDIQAIRGKYDEAAAGLGAEIEKAQLTPQRMRGLYAKFLPLGNASDELRKIFSKPGMDPTRQVTPQDLGMPASGNAPASAQDGEELQSVDPRQAAEVSLSRALDKKPSLSLLAPESKEELAVKQDLDTKIAEEEAILARLEKANTTYAATPEITRRRDRVYALRNQRTMAGVVGWFFRLFRDNESEDVQKARDAFAKYQEENLDREVTKEEFLPIYQAQLEKKAEEASTAKARKIAEAEAKKVARAVEKAAAEAARVEEARKLEQIRDEDARRAAAALDRRMREIEPTNEQRRKQLRGVRAIP